MTRLAVLRIIDDKDADKNNDTTTDKTNDKTNDTDAVTTKQTNESPQIQIVTQQESSITDYSNSKNGIYLSCFVFFTQAVKRPSCSDISI